MWKELTLIIGLTTSNYSIQAQELKPRAETQQITKKLQQMVYDEYEKAESRGWSDLGHFKRRLLDTLQHNGYNYSSIEELNHKFFEPQGKYFNIGLLDEKLHAYLAEVERKDTITISSEEARKIDPNNRAITYTRYLLKKPDIDTYNNKKYGDEKGFHTWRHKAKTFHNMGCMRNQGRYIWDSMHKGIFINNSDVNRARHKLHEQEWKETSDSLGIDEFAQVFAQRFMECYDYHEQYHLMSEKLGNDHITEEGNAELYSLYKTDIKKTRLSLIIWHASIDKQYGKNILRSLEKYITQNKIKGVNSIQDYHKLTDKQLQDFAGRQLGIIK